MARVPWSALTDRQYEDMVSVLLSNLHPTSVRLDGTGGDGGRDVQIEAAEGLRAFELKSFTGRMTPARRRQVAASLVRASELKPTSWTLIVPIDFTPEERQWFKGLQRRVEFPIDAKGLTWLDSRVAERPFIARYFLEDAANEIVRLGRELNLEKAVLAGGVPDAHERIDAVVRQLNRLDPYYKFEITSGEGVRSVKVIPRYVGADRDRPIGVKLTLAFPDDAEGRAAADAFQQAMDYGTAADVPGQYIREAEVDAPAGLGGKVDAARLQISSPEEEATKTFVLAAESPDGKLAVELPLEFKLVSRGDRGAIWTATDRTGTLSVAVTADGREGRFTVNVKLGVVDSYYPHDMLPVVRFPAALVPPNYFSVHDDSNGRVTEPSEITSEPWIAPWMKDYVRDLVLVQTAAGKPRRVHAAATRHDINRVAAAAALLRGEEVEGTWERLVTTVRPDASEEHRRALSVGTGPVRLITHDQHFVDLGSVRYGLGKRASIEYESVKLGGVPRRVEDRFEVDAPPADWAEVIPAGAEVVLVPAASNTARLSLVSDLVDNVFGHDS